MLFLDLSVSLDGYVAGPNQSLEDPLGEGGEQLHEWAFATQSWREAHDQAGGDENVDSQVIAATRARTGATIMGRHMYSGGSGGWEDDPNPRGWWGDDPPFHHPVFVLTHHEREPLEMEGGTTFTFVTDGLESALAQAQAAAGAKDVHIAGGADIGRQYLKAGLTEEMQLHIVPVLLGSGARLLDDHTRRLERTRVVESPSGVVHVSYRVPRARE
jgi:dihydrofolate reductase